MGELTRLEEPITTHDFCAHEVSAVLLDEHTGLQRMQIVDSPTMGRALILDGRWQSSTHDAHIYHEPLVHGSMLHHALANRADGPKSVLIAGGGDWASAREALRWRSVERVVLAEIDPRVLDACRELLPEFHAGCEDDQRLELVVGDAFALLDDAASGGRAAFDVVIGDLSDPIEEGPAAELFTENAYRLVHSALTPGGVFATQAGGIAPAEMAGHVRTRARLHTVFTNAFSLIAPVPIFGTPLGLCLASDAPIDPNPVADDAERLLMTNGVDGLAYLDGQTLARLTYAPVYLERAVSQARTANAAMPVR